MGFKFHVSAADRFRVTEKQVTAGLQVVEEPLQQLCLPFGGEVNQDIHTKNTVKLAHVDHLGKIHRRERYKVTDRRSHRKPPGAHGGEVLLTLLRVNRLEIAGCINAQFRMVQCSAADIRGKYVDIPCLGKLERISYSHCDAVGLFSCGASCTPDAERARVFPKLARVQFGENLLVQGFKSGRVTVKRCFLSQEPLQKRVVLYVGSCNQADEVRTVSNPARLRMLAHTAGEEALARRVKQDSRSRFNQPSNFAQFVFADDHQVPPVQVTVTAGTTSLLRFNGHGPRPPIQDDLHWRTPAALRQHGTAKALHSTVLTCAPAVPLCARSGAHPAKSGGQG